MKPPCEVISKYLLPATRALIVKILIEKYGYTQMAAASKLGMTQSAMSRYLTSERGTKVALTDEIRKFANEIASNIVSNQLTEKEMLKKFCETCQKVRRKQGLCKIHIKTSTSTKES